MARMPLEPPIPVDTRAFFRPVSTGLVAVLRGLSGEDWERPTVARRWVVRDVVAHLLDTTLRRLSFHRDGMKPPPPAEAITSERDFVDFINALNAQWIAASKRLSPRVMTDVVRAGQSRCRRLVRIAVTRRAGAVSGVVGWRAGVGGLVRHRARVHGALASPATDPDGGGCGHTVRSEISGRGDRRGGARVATRVSRCACRARGNGGDRHQRPRRRPMDAGARDRAVDAVARRAVRGHGAYSSGRRRGMEAVVQRAVRERCRASRPRRRTAAARHCSAARSIGGRVDETITTDQVGDLRSDTISSTSTRGQTHEQMGRRGQSSYSRTRQAHDDGRQSGCGANPEDEVARLGKTIATERQLLIDSMSVLLRR